MILTDFMKLSIHNGLKSVLKSLKFNFSKPAETLVKRDYISGKRTKNPFKKPTDLKTREPEVLIRFLISGFYGSFLQHSLYYDHIKPHSHSLLFTQHYFQTLKSTKPQIFWQKLC